MEGRNNKKETTKGQQEIIHSRGLKLTKGPAATSLQELAVDTYRGGGHFPINQTLRRGGKFQTPIADDLIQFVGSGVVKDDTVTFRGAGDFLDDFKVGTILQERGFLSTSLDANVAQQFATKKTASGKRILGNHRVARIKVPKGTQGRFISTHVGEAELLIQAGAKLEVTGIHSGAIGEQMVTFVEMEITP